jgi:hypothetical protein
MKFNQLTISQILIHLHEAEIGLKHTKYPKKLVKPFLALSGDQMELARFGIERHIYYCKRNDTAIEFHTYYEIIMDAKNDLSFAMEMHRDNELIKSLRNNNLDAYLNLFKRFRNQKIRAKVQAI